MDSDSALYAGYAEFKGLSWEEKPRTTRFASWLAPLIPPGCDLLDFGFGAGEVLRWARGRGCTAVGVERLPELVAAALADGFYAKEDASQITRLQDRIIAVDVLEHLSNAQLSAFLEDCQRLLRQGGLMVSRFPNAASPFSGYYQSGDVTHLRALSPSALIQQAGQHGLVHVKTFNPRFRPPGILKSMRSSCAYALRDLVEIAIGNLYFGYRIPLDPNVVVVLKRA